MLLSLWYCFPRQKMDGQSARVSARVANTMSCSVKFNGEGGGCTVEGPVCSTLMMPPPDLQELESSVGEMLASLQNIARDGGHLVVSCSGSSGSRTKFVRAAKTPPATRDKINWLN